MNKEALFKVCAIGAPIGILFLFFASQIFEPRLIQAADIKPAMLGDVVKVCGTAESIRVGKEKTDFLLQDDSGGIAAVFFKKQAVPKQTCIVGQVSVYKQKLQLIADGIFPFK